jgi:uncharacterized protein (TIGR00251 family)
MLWLKADAQGVRFKILVQPRASHNKIAGVHGDALKIKLTAPPVDGAANEMVIAYLAKCLGVAKSRIQIMTGQTGRRKQILVHCTDARAAAGEIDRIVKKIEVLAGG